jgi:hypothetical protein
MEERLPILHNTFIRAILSQCSNARSASNRKGRFFRLPTDIYSDRCIGTGDLIRQKSELEGVVQVVAGRPSRGQQALQTIGVASSSMIRET